MGVFAAELIALAEGRTWFESQASLKTLEGDQLSVLLTIAFPDEPAKLNSVLVSIMDMTEQKRAEDALRQAQADLAHVSRVTTLGEMAASIAHEVDQPLSGIIINANACLRFLTAPSPNLDEVRDGLQAIARDGRRSSDVIARIRALARRTATEEEPLDVNALIREVVTLADGEARRIGATVRTELAGNLPCVLGDRVQLQQVVLNLFLNGLEAMHAVEGRPRELVISTQREATDRVRVSVPGLGIGHRPEACGPFVRARSTRRSAAGWGWVSRSAGRLSSSTAGDSGPCRMTGLARRSSSRSDAPIMPEPQAIVFVVDDDASVREALERLIRSAGLKVEAFASAEEFLKRPRADAPSCLVLDVRLPDLSGLDLQRRMADANNEIPIVFITGHGDIPTTVRAMKAGAVEFLTKPLVEGDVLESIRGAIARDRAVRDHHAETSALRARFASLTPREEEVMGWVVSGLLNKQIAGELGISEETIKVHRGHVMRKMGADSLAELVRMSQRLGIPDRRKP